VRLALDGLAATFDGRARNVCGGEDDSGRSAKASRSFSSNKRYGAPIEGGCRPSRARRTPAFCRASLYFIMAATAFGRMVAWLGTFVALGDHQHHKSQVTSPFRFAFGAWLPEGPAIESSLYMNDEWAPKNRRLFTFS